VVRIQDSGFRVAVFRVIGGYRVRRVIGGYRVRRVIGLEGL